MVKPGTVVAVAIVAVVGFILYQFLKGGEGLSVSPSLDAAQSTRSDIGVSPGGYATASGTGSLAVTQIYSPAISYQTSYQQNIQQTTSNYFRIDPKTGLIVFG